MDFSQMQTISVIIKLSSAVIHCCYKIVGKSIFAKLQLDTFLLSAITLVHCVHNQVGNKKMYITTSTHFFITMYVVFLFCSVMTRNLIKTV